MSEATTYFKCACDHCAGRIEFPAEAVGATINCPHCEARTTLSAPSEHACASSIQTRRIRKRIVLPFAFALLASVLFLVVIARPRPLLVRDLRFERASTNTPGVVTGIVENKSSRARRDARVEVDLLNARGERLWQATDYTPEIGATNTWRFRALVLDPNVVTGKVWRVHEH